MKRRTWLRKVWGRVSGPSKPDIARQALFRWLKFNLVGGIGIAVQLLTLAICRSLLHLDYLMATGLAVETAVIHNFFWHERFTWADRSTSDFTHSLVRFARFNASNGLVSIVGNVLLMRCLAGALLIPYFVASLTAIAICSLANFALSDGLVFRAQTRHDHR